MVYGNPDLWLLLLSFPNVVVVENPGFPHAKNGFWG
jgi:hypothetical protein